MTEMQSRSSVWKDQLPWDACSMSQTGRRERRCTSTTSAVYVGVSRNSETQSVHWTWWQHSVDVECLVRLDVPATKATCCICQATFGHGSRLAVVQFCFPPMCGGGRVWSRTWQRATSLCVTCVGEGRSAKLPNTLLTRECADGLLQSETLACASSMSESGVCVQGVRVLHECVRAVCGPVCWSAQTLDMCRRVRCIVSMTNHIYSSGCTHMPRRAWCWSTWLNSARC